MVGRRGEQDAQGPEPEAHLVCSRNIRAEQDKRAPEARGSEVARARWPGRDEHVGRYS